MTKLEKLFNLAENENIDIHWLDLKDMGLLGLNIKKENLPHMIFLDTSLKENEIKLIEVLSEELGHYFTSVGNTVSNIKTYKDILDVSKCENKATKWATHYLVSEDEIVNLLTSNITCIYEMSDILGIEANMIMKKLAYISKSKHMLDLKNGKYLVLTQLPNLCIYEPVL